MLLNGISRYFEDNFKMSLPCYFFAKTFRLDYFLGFSKKVIRTSINHYRGGKISTQSFVLNFHQSQVFSSVHRIRLYVVCSYVSVFFPPYHLSSCIVSQDKGHFWKSLEYFL